MTTDDTDIATAILKRGTVVRNQLGVELRITGQVAAHESIGTIFAVENADPDARMFSPMRFATRDGLREAGYEVVGQEATDHDD